MPSIASDRVVIAFVGDSLTEGLGVNEHEAFPHQVELLLKKQGIEVKTINAGVSGSTSASGPSKIQWVLKAKPDWIVLALGANDGLRGIPVAEMKKNLIKAIELAEAAKVPLVLAGMRVPPNFGADYAKEFEKTFRDIAAQKKQLLFMPFLLERVGGERDMNQEDGIHPNAKGHKVMAQMVVNTLLPALKATR